MSTMVLVGWVFFGAWLGAACMAIILWWLRGDVQVCGGESCGNQVRMALYEGMSEQEVVKHLREISLRPGWDAVMQLVDRECVGCMDAAKRGPGAEHGEVMFHLGGADALMELKRELREYARAEVEEK